MMSMSSRTVLFLAFLLAAPAAMGERPAAGRPAAGPPAAEPPAVFRQLSLEAGLSQAVIRAVALDAQGLLWMGTEDGLNRYDGYGFTVFRNDPLDPHSLSDNGVLAIAPGRGNVLWLGTTDRGLAQLDLQTQQFRRFLPEPGRKGGFPVPTVLAVLEDRAGRLWAGTGGGGLVRLSPGSSDFTVFAPDSSDPASFPSAFVQAIAEDPSGAIWVGTAGQGLLKLDPGTARVLARYDRDPERPGEVVNAVVNHVLVDRKGRVWAGTGGLARLDPETNALRLYRNRPGDPSSFPSLVARQLAEDPLGRIWIATENGLVRFDPDSDVFTTFRNRPDDAVSLPSDRTNTVLVDRSGLLWVGLDGAGLAVLDLEGSPFRTFRYEAGRRDGLTARVVRGVFEAPDGTLWLGLAGGGVNALDPVTGKVRAFRAGTGHGSLSIDDIWNLIADDEGIVWAGSLGGGLNRIDPVKGTVRVFRRSAADGDSISSDAIRVVKLGRDGTLWLGTAGGGLCRFNRQTGKAACYQNDPGDPSSLSGNVVRAVHEGPSGTLWAGTDAGINRLDPKTGRFTRFLSDPSRPETAGMTRVYGIWESPEGIVWAGTPRGLVRLDPATGAVRRFRGADGLPNESIYSILGDGTGSLWVSSNRGLSRVTPSPDGTSATFRNFDSRDGLQSDEFNGGAFHLGPTGTLWFGGIQGVTGILPSEIREDPLAPPVALLSFWNFGRRIPASAWLPARAITLAPREGFFTIEFAALSYRSAEKNSYKWKLEGLDTDWVMGGPRRKAYYTAVPPGEYVFRVTAANKDGVWNPEGESLRIIVRLPWWRTPRALALWGLLVAIGGVVVSRLEKRRVLGKERQRTQVVEAELRARAAEAQARAIEAESNRKTAELEEGRSMQLSLLPRSTPTVPGFTVAAAAETATEVGGDTWDWALRPDGTLALVIGDATGHGVRAGTVVSLMKGLFRGDPFPVELGAFLDRGGRVLRDLALPRLHMALAILTVKDGDATLASAGMPPAWVRRARTGEVEEILVPGAPLGALVETPHTAVSFRLEPGDVVLLSSDGLAESPGRDGEPLGYARAREYFREAGALPPEEAIATLLLFEKEWRGLAPRADDLTLVLLRKDPDGGALQNPGLTIP